MYMLLKDKRLSVLSLSILLAALASIIGRLINVNIMVSISESLVLIFTFIVYLLYKEKGSLFFGVFLFGLTLSNLTFYFHYFFKDELTSKLLDILYVVTYASLFNHIAMDIKVLDLYKKYKWYILTALVGGVYTFIKLTEITNYHNSMYKDLNFAIDISYNLFIVLILIFSFLNYIYYKSIKAFFLFLGCFGVAITNFTQITSYYIVEYTFYLQIFAAMLFGVTFYFFWRYITYEYFTDIEN